MHWIYWIYSKQEGVDGRYVGKTKSFENRRKQHEYSCNNETHHNYNYPVYKYIRENGGWDAFNMDILEICEDNEASARELYWYTEKQADLNYCVPNRTKKECYEQNRENRLVKMKQYYDKNCEQIKEWQNTKITCECDCVSNNANIARHRKTNRHKENMLKLLEAKSHNNL